MNIPLTDEQRERAADLMTRFKKLHEVEIVPSDDVDRWLVENYDVSVGIIALCDELFPTLPDDSLEKFALRSLRRRHARSITARST